jgi:hypothetical protein
VRNPASNLSGLPTWPARDTTSGGHLDRDVQDKTVDTAQASGFAFMQDSVRQVRKPNSPTSYQFKLMLFRLDRAGRTGATSGRTVSPSTSSTMRVDPPGTSTTWMSAA